MSLFEDLERLENTKIVTLSYAQSIDGCLTDVPGSKYSLSGGESLQLTHQLRSYHEAILVGIESVLADDPKLTVRLTNGTSPQPIILDSKLRFPAESEMINNDIKPWIFTQPFDHFNNCPKFESKRKELEDKGVEIIPIDLNSEKLIDLNRLMEFLKKKNIKKLMVEGGAKIITSFLEYQIANFVVVTIAPLFLGGYSVVQSPLFIKDESQKPLMTKLINLKAQKFGNDQVIWGQLVYGS